MVTSARSARALTAAAQYPVRLCHSITTRGRDDPVTPETRCRRSATRSPTPVASRGAARTRRRCGSADEGRSARSHATTEHAAVRTLHARARRVPPLTTCRARRYHICITRASGRCHTERCWHVTTEGEGGTTMTSGAQKDKTPSQLIDERIKELDDWRGTMLSKLRSLIKDADPDVVEEWKWRGVPTWYHAGMICTGETYKTVVKLTFAKGAALKDPSGLFNSSLEGNVRRAIDLHEGEKINEKAFKALIRAAVTLNTSKVKK